MARPIQPTPALSDKEAKRLQRELANVCTPEEARARIELAKKALTELTRPKFGNRRCP